MAKKTAMHMALNILQKLYAVKGRWLGNNKYTLVVLTGVKAAGT
jgi:hypothetical protein